MTTTDIDNALIIGAEIHYTGDRANASGQGVISRVRPADRFAPISVDVKLEDGREIKALYRSMFHPSIGRRFWLMAEWKAKQAADIEEMRKHYEAMLARREEAR